MRGVRGVGLVLVDPGRGVLAAVGGAVAVAGGAGQHHEVGRGLAGLYSGSSAASGMKTVPLVLGHQVEAVVEELAEQGEPTIVRRRQPLVRGDVRDDDALAVHLHAVRCRATLRAPPGHRPWPRRSWRPSPPRRPPGSRSGRWSSPSRVTPAWVAPRRWPPGSPAFGRR